jgi:ABC-2 type transport system permease protein
MSQFIAFTKKELFESVATFRLWIILAVFAILGVMGPLFAMLTPAIIDMIAAGDAGITITMPEPTAADAWAQFFSNFAQIGTFAIAIIFSGIMGSEFSRGTLVNLLTKGLRRHTVVLSKFIAAAVLWTAALLVAIGICYVYTAFYFEAEPIAHMYMVVVAPWLFGLFIIALLVFGGTVFGSVFGGLGVAVGIFFALVFVNMIPGAERFNPVHLAGGTLNIITGTATAADFIPTLVITVAAVVLLLAGAIAVFNRKKV